MCDTMICNKMVQKIN